jgi:acyl-CoA synthetase (NDP forming)
VYASVAQLPDDCELAVFTVPPPKVISQSGAVCAAILDWSLRNGAGFSKFVSMGNKVDVDESRLIDFLSEDPDTDVIVGYPESVKNGKAFIEAAKRSSPKKPIVLFKAGTTALGAKAATSHTGALAGSDQAFSAACRQTGIIRSPLMEQLFDFALAFASGRELHGNRIAVVERIPPAGRARGRPGAVERAVPPDIEKTKRKVEA